jgi:hypothetical protein
MPAEMPPNLSLPPRMPHPGASPERQCHTAPGPHDRPARLPCFAPRSRSTRAIATALCGAILLISATSPPRADDAVVNLKLGRADNAIDDYGAALSLDPKRASSLYGRGIAKTRKGDADAGKRDIAAAKAIQATIADEFAGYGIR